MKRLLSSVLIAGLVITGLLLPTGPALAATQSATVETTWTRYSINQLDAYELTASAGPLSIQLTDVSAPVAVVILNANTGSILLSHLFNQSDTTAQVDVPQAGTYMMELVPNLVGHVTLTGNDLTVTAPEVPAVKLPVLQKYQWITQPLTVNAAVLNPAVTTKLNVYLLKGGLQSALQQISQQVAPLLSAKPAADGSVAPVTIDPATLADGIYTLAGFGLGQNDNIGGMALRLLVVDKAPVFSDVPATQWARQWVDALSYMGVVNGRGAGTFAPAAEVTRAEFAKMLALAIGLKPASGNDFADVPDDWSRPYIEALYQAKLVTGEMANGQRSFYPTRSISRAEAATIIGRSQGVADGAYTVGNTGFTDFNQVPTWAQHAVVVLTQRLLINGFPDNTFRPLQTLHRDQAAKILGSVMGIGQ